MSHKARLLLVDDDATLIKALEIYLSRAGYEIHSAANGVEGLRKLFDLRPDLVVLDVMMPQLDGWETCQRIRDMSTVPIIMLTARGQESERVKGLELGADDYVAKPFSLKELEARIEAILRRTRGSESMQRPKVLYMSDGLVIDSEAWEVRRKGERIELTSTEARLLFYLAENAGRVLSHRQILTEVWGPEYIDNLDYTKLFVWRLRQKIEDDPSRPRYILTERGIGYRMTPQE
ncbi:MAG TPA: response regulator transcription factor [Chloroflexi bacterium]|jgi:DNA-binding response OmpR family regulator|nr:response regulator transcription factor [Chloroflexota bacterium]